MKKLRRFKCGSCQREYEKLVKDDIETVDCECGSQATKQISAARYLGNTVGKSPSR